MMTNTKTKLIIAILSAGAALAGLSAIVIAAEKETADGPKEKAAIAAAKVTLKQAIATAEQAAGGKATANGIENQDDSAIYYDVTVDKAGVPQKVLIDMQSGKVVSVAVEDNKAENDKKD